MSIAEHIATQVAIQGGQGSFHEIASRNYFGEDIELSMCDSFPALFRTLSSRKANFGVVAIENSVAGTLLPNYALLRNSGYRIIGEEYLRIEHQLMALPGQEVAGIREVYSHPMALQQCMLFLDKHPHMRLVESHDTADSGRWLREERVRGVAAIASRRAAELFGLEILVEGVEDNHQNFTRFLIISPEDQPQVEDRVINKASLCFNLAHRVGSLAQILLVLSSHAMNLSKIQSLPIVGQAWEYFFHVDLEFEDYDQYRRSLQAIDHLVDQLNILGEYQRGKKHSA